jgi:hypothetical protein
MLWTAPIHGITETYSPRYWCSFRRRLIGAGQPRGAVGVVIGLTGQLVNSGPPIHLLATVFHWFTVAVRNCANLRFAIPHGIVTTWYNHSNINARRATGSARTPSSVTPLSSLSRTHSRNPSCRLEAETPHLFLKNNGLRVIGSACGFGWWTHGNHPQPGDKMELVAQRLLRHLLPPTIQEKTTAKKC